MRYCQDFGRDALAIGASRAECVAWLSQFVGYECGVRQMNPDSVKGVYIPAILAMMSHHGVVSKKMIEASTHDIVNKTFTGMKKFFHKVHPTAGKVKVPFTISAANKATSMLQSKELVFPKIESLDPTRRALAIDRIGLALLFGIFFLLRKSEFLYKKATDQPATRHHLILYDQDDRIIPYAEIGIIRATRVLFDVHRGKADQHGKCRFNSHTMQDSGTCIVSRLERYIAVTRGAPYHAKATDVLFEVKGLPRLTAGCLETIMKAVVTSFGLPADRISAHSLRYGGATLLAAAGFPEYVIAQYGGWAEGSESLRIYTRPTKTMIDRVSKQMSAGGCNSVEHELMMHIIAVDAIEVRARRAPKA